MSRKNEKQSQSARSFGDFFAAQASSDEERERLRALTTDPSITEDGKFKNYERPYEVNADTLVIPGFRSVDKIVYALRERGVTPLLADQNISGGLITFLLNKNIGAINMRRTYLINNKDENIFGTACRLNVPIITHDGDFLNYTRFDPKESPGIIVFRLHRRNSVPSRIVLDHFVQSVPADLEEWHGTIREYTAQNELVIYSPPFRPDPKYNGSRSIPTSRTALTLK